MDRRYGPVMDTRTCERCGERVRSAGVGRPPRYCSRNCRQRAYETRRALAELGVVGQAPPGVSAPPGIDSDETQSVSDESRAPARGLPPPSAELLAELGMTAAHFEEWRRRELSRPPMVLPFADE